MNFEHFVSLCGSSLFAEEYKGDLDAAYNYLQQLEVQYNTLDLNNKAEYLRCSSIYAILTGNISNAYKNLDSLHNLLNQLPPEWGLRYTNYKLLADYTRRFPPIFRFHQERGWPLNIPMLANIIGPMEISQSFMKNVNTHLPHGLPRDQALCQILNIISWAPTSTRHLTQQFHPLSPGGANYTPDQDAGSVIEISAKNILTRRDLAQANGAEVMANYLSRLVVEFYIACASPEKEIMLLDLYQRCERVSDYDGMGNAKLLEGDSILCAPFTSPLALNLVPFNASAAVGDDTFWDPIEFDLEFDYSDTVKGCYESALDLFKISGSKRGQAAVLFRQGCCLHNLARLQRKSNKEYAVNLLIEAETKLQDALVLFGRDEANVQFVRAHQILLAISKRNPQRVKKLARDIGDWCATAKNEMTAHALSLLIGRFAYQEWHIYSNLDTAQQAWECVYEISRAVNDMVPLFQSIVCRAELHFEMFSSAAARLLIEEALENIEEVRDYLSDKIQTAPQTQLGRADFQLVQTTKCLLLWTFGRLVAKVYMRSESGDTAPFLKWHARLSDWVENDEDFREWRERIEVSETPSAGDYKIAIAPPEHKKGGLWKKGLADDAANARYVAAEFGFRRLLGEGDVLGAEETFRQYVNESENEGKVYTRDLYRVLACDRIGDRARAREIFDSISDDELFDGNLESYQQGIGVRSSLPTVGQNALTFALFAGDFDRARRLVRMINDMNPTFFDSVIENSLDYSLRLGQYAAIMSDTEPQLCFSKLLNARQLIEDRRRQTTDLDARIWSSHAGWSGEVYLDLARICLRADNLGLPLELLASSGDENVAGASWVDQALLFVEMSRARAVLESLQTQAATATGLSEAPNATKLSEAVHKRRLLRSLLSLEILTSDQEKEVAQLRDDIKELEGDGTLSSATTFIDTVNSSIEPKLLYQNIDEDALVIETTFGSRGMIAFAVTKEGIQETHQSSFRRVDMQRPVMRALQIMRELTGYISDEEEKQKKLLNELCSEISEVLLVPFAEIIRTKSHIIFSVSDPLTAFPFSILPFDDKPLIIQAVVSQVPSLTVLYYLSQRKSTSASPTVSVLAKSPTEESSSSTRAGNEVNLHMAGIEAVNIARMFATWPIEASQMTRKDFQQHVEGGSLIMHIGTHGDINNQNPLLSSISIGHGQEFRVVDMSAIKSNVNLLVFAACLSGFGRSTIGSEVLGFSHVVLSTGCQAYIGSLWKVSDFGSMLIMTLFYQYLKANPHRPVAEAMRAAQMGLLQLDTDKANVLLDQLADNWSRDVETGQSPAEFVPDAEFLLWTLKMILEQLDWSSPFYWAPFTLVGYGGFRFLQVDHSSCKVQLDV
ncbi:hypothetical protein N7456_005999 [Penicillium angulare]|uniref:CHAT domain-containing protein n=1 Tax=Penicillium angulare TaxID=116970 RepID=A0A9W9FZJ8_9EURO|nr:hypothetical protein N7456_005999 [Penicillium angulare]